MLFIPYDAGERNRYSSFMNFADLDVYAIYTEYIYAIYVVIC